MTVDVSTPKGDTYVVDLAFPGSCDCPAYRTCKHLRDVWTLSKGGLFDRDTDSVTGGVSRAGSREASQRVRSGG